MTKYLILSALLFLSGCFSKPVPVRMEFPDAPQSLLKKCEELKTIEPKAGGTPITELLKTVVENYKLYYSCANKVEGWQTWYHDQKEIFESVK